MLNLRDIEVWSIIIYNTAIWAAMICIHCADCSFWDNLQINQSIVEEAESYARGEGTIYFGDSDICLHKWKEKNGLSLAVAEEQYT